MTHALHALPRLCLDLFRQQTHLRCVVSREHGEKIGSCSSTLSPLLAADAHAVFKRQSYSPRIFP
jgi:hypothetical protein